MERFVLTHTKYLPTYLHYAKQHREGFLRAHCIVPAFSIVLPLTHPTLFHNHPQLSQQLLHFSFLRHLKGGLMEGGWGGGGSMKKKNDNLFLHETH
jgi:hypothetical protein